MAFVSQPCFAADFLQEGRSGKILCYQSANENLEAKTCVSVAEYSFSGKSIHEHAEALVSLNPLTILESTEDLVDDGENRCRPVNKKVFEEGRYFRKGVELHATTAEVQKAEIAQRTEALIGHVMCLYELPSENGPVYDMRRDGVTLDRPLLRVRWIGKQEGYRLFGGEASKILGQ